MRTRTSLEFTKAKLEHLDTCSEILRHSLLGEEYFCNSKGEYIGQMLLLEGIEKREIYISKNALSDQIVGFSWIQERGIFNWFPFLHVVVIAESERSKGYGKQHMNHFHEICSEKLKVDKGFLMVGKDNVQALKLYEVLGYKKVGTVPNLLIQGKDEILMFKEMY